MTDAIYRASDFSGIQRFVVLVKTAGKAQAKRFRARSFLVEVSEHGSLRVIQNRRGRQEDSRGRSRPAHRTLHQLRAFSRDIHEFFGERIQDLMFRKWP